MGRSRPFRRLLFSLPALAWVIPFGLMLTSGGSSGCLIVFPSDVLSALLLNPDVFCEQLAERLRLGSLPSGSTPADIGLRFEPLTVTSANGQPLSAWFLPAQSDGQLDPSPSGTVLVMHGTDGPIACALPWAIVAVSNRMNAIVFDYQGFGDSGGSPDVATLLDDSEAVLSWILSDPSPARQSVHLVGVSLGTSPSLGLVSLRPRPEIRSVTLDGTFDPCATLESLTSFVGPLLPLLDPNARLAFPWLFEMRARLGEIAVPMMFLHAEQDMTTPLAGAQLMFDLSGSWAKSFWVFDGLTHVQPLFLAEEGYVSLMVTFWRDLTSQPDPNAAATDPTIILPQY